MKILYLTIKGKWYDMIRSKEKREEYRDIKDFWVKRLCKEFGFEGEETICTPKDYTHVCFARGGHFHKSIPQMTLELKCISIDYGMMIWGAEKDKKYFVLSLGEIISKTHQP